MTNETRVMEAIRPEPGQLGYLASPISHASKPVRLNRYLAAMSATWMLTKSGYRVYCPHVHWCDISENLGLPEDWEFWGPISKLFLDRCDYLLVLTTDGWQESQGVDTEVKWARKRGIPVSLTDGVVVFPL